MAHTPAGESLLRTKRDAEDALRRLDPKIYEKVEHWLDKELYGGLYGHGGCDRLPAAHLPEIRNLLRARVDVYRGRKSGAVAEDDGSTYDGEVGNEQMAQTIEACLKALGEGPRLPPGRRWDDFLPEWS
jgi:hypothetical protein